MQISKFLMTLFVAVLILSFAFTTVGAQTNLPPVGEVDEDGDLIVDIFPQVDVSAARELTELTNPAALVDFADPAGVISADLSTPSYPKGDQFVVGKYPTFRFTKDAAALKYQIEVYDVLADPDVLVYKFKGSGGDCPGGICELTPTTALKPMTIFNKVGRYGWIVRTKTVSGWSTIWSEPAFFYVFKNGFNSLFTTLDNKWFPVYGTWTLTSAGYAKTIGELDLVSSAIEKHPASDYYVYEVKMKRKVEPGSANQVIFQAYPFELTSQKNWNSGYIFRYFNNGLWSLSRVDDGLDTILLLDDSAYIKPYDWNIITVYTDTPYIDLWINGQWLGCIGPDDSCAAPADITYQAGYVGFGMFESLADKSPLLVDYAKLYYSDDFPYPITTTADGQRAPVGQTQHPVIVENPDIAP